MDLVAEERKESLMREAERLAERLSQGPAKGQSPVNRNLLQSTLESYLSGGLPVEGQRRLLRALARRGNPLHRRSRQTGPQYARLEAVVGPFLSKVHFTDAERRWVLGWTARLLEVRHRLRR